MTGSPAALVTPEADLTPLHQDNAAKVADAILGRIARNAHGIHLRGDSLRRRRGARPSRLDPNRPSDGDNPPPTAETLRYSFVQAVTCSAEARTWITAGTRRGASAASSTGAISASLAIV